MNKVLDTPIFSLVSHIQSGNLSAKSLIDECYQNIEQFQPLTNALITLREKSQVHKDLSQIQKSKISYPLLGIPFVLKDSYVTENIYTTAASNILKKYLPQYNSTVYQKLLNAGALLIGKANMDAWGHGASTENTDFGPTKNPYDLSRVAGGSSGGPAVAIATRMCSFAIGEDTGGSIRNPSAWNNLSGLKVTYGRVSRYGCIAYASSFDTVGPMAKYVEDLAYILEIISGHDPYDATSSTQKVDRYFQLLSSPIKFRIGIPQEVLPKNLNPEIKQSLLNVRDTLIKAGHIVKEVSMPLLVFGLPIYYLIGPSETSSNLSRYDGVRFGSDRSQFTNETVRRIMTGTFALSSGYYDAYYRQAQKGRTLLIQEYDHVFKQVDILLTPVNPNHPPKFGELLNDPVNNMLADVFTITQNIVGVPSLSIPAGFSRNGLPIGVQLTGPMFSETMLLTVGHEYQQATSWHLSKPNIYA